MKIAGFWLGAVAVLGSTTGQGHAQAIVITDVAVVSAVDDTFQPGMTVVVEDGRIKSIGPDGSIPLPDGAQPIPGEGQFLIPGLWDMHVHSSTDYNQRQVFLPLYIANGVTGVRDLNGDCFDPCGPLENPRDTVRAWIRDIEAGVLVGPRIVASSEIIHPPAPGEPSTIEAPATEEHGRALARLLADRGVDMIKVYDGVPREAFYGLLEEGRSRGLPVVGHVPLSVPATEAAAAGMRSMEHLFAVIDECSTTEPEQRPAVVEARREGDFEAVMQNLFTSFENFSLEKCQPVYRALAESGTWVVPTLAVHGAPAEVAAWRDHPGMRYLPRNELEYWLGAAAGMISDPGGLSTWAYVQLRMGLVAKDLHDAGARMLAGSDALAVGVFPGFGLHDELESMVDAGLTPAEALVSATLEPARYLQATDSLGTIEPGKVADLVLLGGNPLEDIRNTRRIQAVIVRGRWFDRRALDHLLDQAAESAVRQ